MKRLKVVAVRNGDGVKPVIARMQPIDIVFGLLSRISNSVVFVGGRPWEPFIDEPSHFERNPMSLGCVLHPS